MNAQYVALAVGLALVSAPFLLLFLIVKYIGGRRRRQALEARIAREDRVTRPSAETPEAPPSDASAGQAPPPLPRPATAPLPKVAARPATQYRFVALDVETASGGRDSICQLGLAFVTAAGTIDTTSTLVNPRQVFTNTSIHGISPRDVIDAPLWPEVFRTFSRSIARQPVIQHSGFDRSSVNAACERHGITAPDWRWYDSLQIARRAWPELAGNGGHGLGNLKRHLSIDFEHHHAEEDARAAAIVVLRAEAATGLEFPALLRDKRAASAARSSRVRAGR